MRGRWSTGVVVAIALAIAAAAGALGSGGSSPESASPVQFAAAQAGDGVTLSVAFAGVVVTLDLGAQR